MDFMARTFGTRAYGAYLFLAAVFLAVTLIPEDSFAYPFFARKVGRDCTYCHSVFPRLKETGRIYRSNGYRFAGEEWTEAKDWTGVPLSAEVEVEGIYNRLKSGGVRTESSDLKVEEVEITSGGSFGKTGRITALASVVSGQTDTGTDTSIHKAFIQVNDLVGEAGEGVLNLRAGLFDIGMPFLNTAGTAITNRYLADSALGLLTAEQRAVELNGSVVADEESSLPTHRYSVGVAREDVNDDNRLRGFYAAYSATFREKYSLGAILRGGREMNGSTDVSVDKWGLAADAEAGPVIVTLGYFNVNRSGLANRDNIVAELVYQPAARVSLAARYDYLKEKGKAGTKSQSIMARYNILSNAYTQLEYRGLTDKEHVAGVNESEEKLRLLLVAVF